jgi:hypothetical protein
MRLIDEHLERRMGITTTEIKSDIEKLIKQKQCQIPHE